MIRRFLVWLNGGTLDSHTDDTLSRLDVRDGL